ncbi:MAG: RsmD family RNA methyltransferase, partial [Deltaproteobacteria bacterium]|nr:RsmD family RNA methyltransferase [Deltaproteobacteria bacterium]
SLPSLARAGEQFDLVFLDPPYRSDLLARSLDLLVAGPLLAREALVVAELPVRDELSAPAGLRLESVRSYGATSLGFMRPSREGAAAAEERRR